MLDVPWYEMGPNEGFPCGEGATTVVYKTFDMAYFHKTDLLGLGLISMII